MSVWEDAFMFGVWAAARVVVDDPKLTGLYGCAGEG